MESDRGVASVIDHRTPPRGVLPRGTQMWLMIGLALVILGIIVFAGRPQPAARPATVTAPQSLAPSPDRVREYQDRLRILDERARQQALSDAQATAPMRAVSDEPPATPTPDPVEAERKRRAYESLFASNVVMSRRPGGQQLTTPQPTSSRTSSSDVATDTVPAPPSIDAVADAVVRATTRYTPPNSSPNTSSILASPASESLTSGPKAPTPKTSPATTGPITSSGPLHRVLEGTLIDTVLTNRLDGSVAAPVNCLVTNAVYSHDGQYVLIPAGSRVLGETKPVQTFGETRLAVAFDRLVLPDGSTFGLDQFMGLNEIGDAGLRDQVNQRYRSTFGASAAVGLITGFAQSLGAGFSRGGNDRTVIITGHIGDATAQATTQTMNRFLNRLPSITIREGHRVKVYLTSDLELPAYEAAHTGVGNRTLLPQSRSRNTP